MEMSRGWQELGVVDTIYEDDHEAEEDEEEEEEERFDSPTMSSSAATSRSCSPEVEEEDAAAAAHPSLPPALWRAVQAWYVPPRVAHAPRDRFDPRVDSGRDWSWSGEFCSAGDCRNRLTDRSPSLMVMDRCRSRANGSRKPDVIVRVQEHRLPLHRVTHSIPPPFSLLNLLLTSVVIAEFRYFSPFLC